MFILKLSEELHNDLLESREVPTAWETPIARQIARRSFMNAITSHGNISSVMLIRMNCRCFVKLCHLLVTEGGLRGSWNIEVDEMVAMFLYTIAHNEKNRVLQVVFRRSGETISRVIHSVLFAVLKLHNILYHKPEPRKEVVASGMTEEIAKFHPLLEKTAACIERMVNSLCHDDDIMIRRGSLYSEISALGGLSNDQVVAASLALMKDDQAAQLYRQLPTDEDKFSFLITLIN